MPLAEFVLAVQTGSLSQTSNSPGAEDFVVGLIIVVPGVFALIFIRTSTRRSSKR